MHFSVDECRSNKDPEVLGALGGGARTSCVLMRVLIKVLLHVMNKIDHIFFAAHVTVSRSV